MHLVAREPGTRLPAGTSEGGWQVAAAPKPEGLGSPQGKPLSVLIGTGTGRCLGSSWQEFSREQPCVCSW